MRGWILAVLAFAATAGLLFATVSLGIYRKGPDFQPYWEDQAKRLQIISQATVGIRASEGDRGIVIVGYRDQLNATNRQQLLQTLSSLLSDARGYTVILAPWADDNATRAYLALLYAGRVALASYLAGNVTAEGAVGNSTAVEAARQLALNIQQAYGYRSPYPAAPPIYVLILPSYTQYVVYEPYQPLRDSSYADWYRWVRTAIANLNAGQGRVTP